MRGSWAQGLRFINLLVLSVELPKIRGSEGEERVQLTGSGASVRMHFGETWEEGKRQMGRKPQSDWELRRLRVRLWVLAKIVTRPKTISLSRIVSTTVCRTKKHLDE